MGRWKKGQSGNPGGRPRGFKGLAKYIQNHTNDGQELIDFMLKLLRGETIGTKMIDGETSLPVVHTPSLSDRIGAAGWLADRGFGKPVQSVELADVSADGSKLVLPDIDSMDTDKLKQIEGILDSISGASEDEA